MRQNSVYTVTANCQDCYRCVRVCPVKAIRVSGGQAKIDPGLCIKCGTCVRECPQDAKRIRSDYEEVKSVIAAGQRAAASVAPSFAAAAGGKLAKKLPSVLRRLGFKYVAETAEGAEFVTQKSFLNEGGGICTACPAVVNYAEKYRPELIGALIPVVSPMIAHGRMLKKRYGDCTVVFIGPCAAKKDEIVRPENIGAVDFVLTFDELFQWIGDEAIDFESSLDSDFDNAGASLDARLFPLEGGMLKTANMEGAFEEVNVLKLSGADDVISLLSDGDALGNIQYIEPLFCKGGCIGGPCIHDDSSLLKRRKMVLDYWKGKAKSKAAPSFEVDCLAHFEAKPAEEIAVSQAQLAEIYEKTGKADPSLRLNCGACGYKSCEEKAIAVAKGMADHEMCIPYMRRLAQQRTDRIIETTPNGIVIVDSDLCIIKMNPAFQTMFMCNNGILGRRISYLVDADGFELLQSGKVDLHEAIHTKYSIRYHEILYPLPEDGQYVGIYSDISKLKYDVKQLDVIKVQTLAHAREFLEHQIKLSQEMAHYLGKSTAQSEEIARKLINLYEGNDD